MRVYLDNNATTKLDREVLDSMMPYMTEIFGNASSHHSFGQEAAKGMNESREKIAELLGVTAKEIIFTGSGVEADNLAIRGVAKAYKNRGNHLITSAIEHPGVKETFADLKKEGFEVTVLPVDENGLVSMDDLRAAIKEETILISIMHANNEIGTIEQVEEIGKIAKENKIIYHMDAVQTMGKIPVKPLEIGADIVVFSAHKFYGPKGIGAMYVRNGVRLGKTITGGGQEGKLRPGTSNVAAMVGMAKALERAIESMDRNIKHETELRDYFEKEILARVPEIVINAKTVNRLPGTSSVQLRYLEGESILLSLNYKGIAVSSGSACSSDELQASHVLLAIGVPVEFAHGTIRFSLGKDNTKEEIDYTIEAVVDVANRLRTISPLWEEFTNKR
ncbi:MAG: cysteine desulfurase family protein [Fusobacteriaceae bacterium]